MQVSLSALAEAIKQELHVGGTAAIPETRRGTTGNGVQHSSKSADTTNFTSAVTAVGESIADTATSTKVPGSVRTATDSVAVPIGGTTKSYDVIPGERGPGCTDETLVGTTYSKIETSLRVLVADLKGGVENPALLAFVDAIRYTCPHIPLCDTVSHTLFLYNCCVGAPQQLVLRHASSTAFS